MIEFRVATHFIRLIDILNMDTVLNSGSILFQCVFYSVSFNQLPNSVATASLVLRRLTAPWMKFKNRTQTAKSMILDNSAITMVQWTTEGDHWTDCGVLSRSVQTK